MSLKKAERLAERVIIMVESGDYDKDIVKHMIKSLIVGRDRRIKFLETQCKPRTFDMTIKRISGALRNTIKEHGNITPKTIGSAAKRIYGNCQQVEHVTEPVASAGERIVKGTVTVIRDKVTCHKLTVARDGNIRIKIAIGSSNEEANKIIESFTKIAVDAINLNKGTLRGKLSPDEIFKARYTSITMYNDSKSEKFNFNL